MKIFYFAHKLKSLMKERPEQNIKLKIAVVTGGHESEYKYSLISARNAIAGLEYTNKYRIKLIVITPEMKWIFLDDHKNFLKNPGVNGFDKSRGLESHQALAKMKKENVDVAFLTAMGPMGESGEIQGFLETAGIPYTGSSVSASALAMDKIKSSLLLRAAGLNTPDFIYFNGMDWKRRESEIIRQSEKK